jgi:alkyl hydroperoxide reductase subunit AhpC
MSIAPERVERFRRKVGQCNWPIVADPVAQAAATYGVAERIYGVLEWVNAPAVFVVGRDGVLRWSYVGRELTDRPSVDRVLEELP